MIFLTNDLTALFILFLSFSSIINTQLNANNLDSFTTLPTTSTKTSDPFEYIPLKSTFDVLYMVPEDLDDVLNLNEKHTIGNEYNKGWILPSDQELSLNLYLYYDGQDENKIKPFLKQGVYQKNNETSFISASTNDSISKDHGLITNQASFSSATLYLFFTPENHCEDYMKRNYWPFEIVERIASNMYKAKLNSISLTYSSKPLFICMQQFDSDENIHDQYRYYSHQGDDYWVSIVTTKILIPLWARIILFIVLLSLSGLFSGLNLGLMSLDVSELDILMRIGTPSEQSYASKIYPLRKRGNFLLCTILLGNVLVNSVSTLILGDMLSGVYAAFGSTILIVIFGEIIPQAACSKHGLAVGAYTRHITYLFMVLTCPLSFPLSIVLDKVLGQEITATYNREKIREVMNVVEGLDEKEKKIISGALDFNNKKVREVMTLLNNVFMLEVNSCLDFETIAKIAQEGYSRIPVYETDRENVVGLLHVKDFTLLDPDDNMPVEALLKFYNHVVIYCDAEESLDERFEEFRKGETHLAFVNDVIQQADKDPLKTCVGIVTLEDIIEELVQMEIYDEYDDKNEIEKEENKNTKYNIEESTTVYERNEYDKSDHELLILSNMDSTNTGSQLVEQTKFCSSYQLLRKNSDDDKQNKTSSFVTKANGQNQKSSSKINHTQISYESQASKDLSFFVQQQKDTTQRALISPQIRFVMFQFLYTTVKPFTSEFLTKNVLELIFKRAVFKESKRSDPKLPREYLYKYGKGCNYFILILSGEATIEVGKEKLEFSAGPFAYFGVNALLCGYDTSEQVIQDDPSLSPLSNEVEMPLSKKAHSKQYVPDFSLRVDEKCVYMKIDHNLWRNGVIKSRLEKLNNQISDNIDYFPSEQVNQVSDSDVKFNNSRNDLNSIVPTVDQVKKPISLGVNKAEINRRSSSIVSALAKVQEATSDNNKLISPNKKSQLNQRINEFIDSENPNETEPFLLSEKKSSTISLNVNV